MRRKNTKKGFTLLELLVVVVIIGILASIALPQYKMATLKAKYARAKQTVSDIRKAYEFYYTVHNEFPTKFSDLDFANKFDDSNTIQTNDYRCEFQTNFNNIVCSISNETKLRYVINFYTAHSNKISIYCRATTDTSDIYNKICQQETGKTANQASCKESGYCQYIY